MGRTRSFSFALSLQSPRNRFCRPFLFNNLHTLFHSLQKSESPSPFLSSSCALLAKTPCGYPSPSPQNRNYSSLFPFLFTSLRPYFFTSLCAKLSPMTSNPLHLDVNENIECAHTLASRF